MTYQTSNLNNIYLKRPYKRKRISSYDKKGGNDDRIHFKPNQIKTIANIKGPAVITHFWCTIGNIKKGDKSGTVGHEIFNNRKVLIRVYWDDEKIPSIEAPLGDFFGMGHGITKEFNSEPLQMATLNGTGFNCWWPMPFKKKAKFEIENNCVNELVFYFYLDYEEVDELPKDSLYFHASWNREIAKGKDEKNYPSHTAWIFGDEKDNNLTGKDNYVLLDTRGNGQYVGCNLNIVNLNTSNNWDWYGEGDDMIFVDGEKWPPTLHGTGLEDYFCCAWSPNHGFISNNFGLICDDKDNFKGKSTWYRYHTKDPVPFEKSIKVSIEHGHNNLRSDDYSSTAYWYQAEPHQEYKKMLAVKDRMPINESTLLWKNKVELHEISDHIEYDS